MVPFDAKPCHEFDTIVYLALDYVNYFCVIISYIFTMRK